MMLPWCIANHCVIPGWLEAECARKQCPHLVYMCEVDIVAQQSDGLGGA
jgi:hypothetical protein